MIPVPSVISRISDGRPYAIAGEAGPEYVTPSLPGFASGGMIPVPSVISRISDGRPYAIAGEAGPEYVTPGGSGIVINIDKFQANNRNDIDYFAAQLVNRIKLKTGVR
jgi:hypothetical protein